jgi:hypothetical protein
MDRCPLYVTEAYLFLLTSDANLARLAWISSGNGAAFVNLKDPGNNIAIGQSSLLVLNKCKQNANTTG